MKINVAPEIKVHQVKFRPCAHSYRILSHFNNAPITFGGVDKDYMYEQVVLNRRNRTVGFWYSQNPKRGYQTTLPNFMWSLSDESLCSLISYAIEISFYYQARGIQRQDYYDHHEVSSDTDVTKIFDRITLGRPPVAFHSLEQVCLKFGRHRNYKTDFYQLFGHLLPVAMQDRPLVALAEVDYDEHKELRGLGISYICNNHMEDLYCILRDKSKAPYVALEDTNSFYLVDEYGDWIFR